MTFRCAPVGPGTARQMVASVQAAALLAGVRGEPASDVGAVGEAIERVAQMLLSEGSISEVDLNPVIVGPQGRGVTAVDVRIVLAARPS